MKKRRNPNALSQRVMSVMEPGRRILSSDLAQMLNIARNRASMVLADLTLVYPERVKRNRLYNTGESACRWEYYIEREGHCPERWSDDGLMTILTMLDQSTRMRMRTQQSEDDG